MSRTLTLSLRWIGLAMVLAALLLTFISWQAYTRQPLLYPPGQTIAGVPVGGLEPASAAEKVAAAYALPVEIRYAETSIQVSPAGLGFTLDMEAMLDQAEAALHGSFWDSLWNRAPGPVDVPLQAQVSTEAIRAFLAEEISPRYDQPPVPALPRPADPLFTQPRPGTAFDLDQAVDDLSRALLSRTEREVPLAVREVQPARIDIQNLQILLEQILVVSGYSGLAEIYIQDQGSGEVIHFAWQQGSQVPQHISFSAASIIKIPIMVSVYRRLPEPAPETVLVLLREMIEQSDNAASDRVAQLVLDPNLAPLQVTEDMRALELKNTFWGGYFYLGAPLLQRFETPANLRADISTDPDVYSQTTPGDTGWLLGEIDRCAKGAESALTAAWPGEITQAECAQMIDLLWGDHLPQLIQAGLPEGTRFAHKHGWAVDAFDGLLHNMADAGVVYSPGGDYVITVFFYQSSQLLFDPGNELFTRLSQAVYQYFQIPR